jgi:hypothetical protein
MKSGRTLVVAILGVAILGYVVYRLTGDSAGDVKSRDAYAQQNGDQKQGKKRRVPTQRHSGPDGPVAGGKKGKRRINNPPNLQPPPPPPPPMSKEEAREAWATYETELKEVYARVQETKVPLPNDEWVELYRRGNEAINPLQQALDSADPNEADEVNNAHESFRETIMKMEPGRPID